MARIASVLIGAIAALVIGMPGYADPVRDSEWHLAFLNVAQAHTYSQGEGVVVAVVDTGVDASHPDLAGSVLAGHDFTNPTGDGHEDIAGHGTAMAGMIVGHGRILGIAPKAKVLPVRDGVSAGGGFAPSAIDWAIGNGATVLCLAFGGPASPELRRAIENAVANDVVVVAAVGNTPEAAEQYPAGYPGVVGAAGVDQKGNHAAISVVSPYAVLAAPAVDVASTDIRIGAHTGYGLGNGTSASTAIIAGAAALVRAKYPNMKAFDVIHRLTATADDKGAPGRDNEYGYGVVNLVKALTADVPPITTTPSSAATTRPTTALPHDDDGGSSRTTIIVIGALALIAALAAAGIIVARRRRT